MKPRLSKSITLLELLIALTLVGVIVLAFSGIELFSRYHVTTADRRAKVQNEVSYVLEHMNKEISRAIGNELVDGNQNVTRISNVPLADFIQAFVDTNPNGVRDAGDHWIAYRRNLTNYHLDYCSNCSMATGACSNCIQPWEILSERITAMNSTSAPLTVTIVGCWDPRSTAFACGTSDNPSVNMSTSINMPSVSTR